MNDEIKEILDDLKDNSESKYINPFELTDESCKILLDYITNLQQENKRLKEIRINKSDRSISIIKGNIAIRQWIIDDEILDFIEELYNEVIRLREENKDNKQLIETQLRGLEKQKQIIDKAIKYIKNNEVCCLEYIGRNEITGNLEKQIQRDLVNRTDLLNILEGKD